ncbi:hypothetical protein ABH912_003858 [Pseudomonas sp. BT76 TE3572]
MRHWKKIAVIIADSFIDCTDAIASRLAPTFGMHSPVGVSLLAKAVVKSPQMYPAKP